MSIVGTQTVEVRGVRASAAPDPALASAYAHCAHIARTRARNFYYGLRLTPEPKRSAIYSVYAWMRAADDEADAATDASEKRRRLDAFRATTERMLRGGSGSVADEGPVWRAFARTVTDFGLSPQDLRHLLDGLDRDLDAELAGRARGGGVAMICSDRQQLREYCYCVASTVGLVCVGIWGLRAPELAEPARPLSVQRGLAFQLTNILRDFAQDHDEGRVYLARSDFERHGLTPGELRRWEHPDRCAALVRDVASWARSQYDDSAVLDEMLDRACVPAIRAMTGIYSGLLGIIERSPARIAGPARIRLPSWAKAVLALRALAAAKPWRTTED